jgi:hypothetical protein
MDTADNKQLNIFDVWPELDPEGLWPVVETIEPEDVPCWNGFPDNDDESDPTVQTIIDNQQADDGFYSAQEEYDETMAAIESQLATRFGKNGTQPESYVFFLHARRIQPVWGSRRTTKHITLTDGGIDRTGAHLFYSVRFEKRGLHV